VNKYNPIPALQCVVRLDAPVWAIFDTAAGIVELPGPKAACTPLELLEWLYGKDGEENCTVAATASALGVTPGAVYGRRRMLLQRIRAMLKSEEVDDV